MSVEIDNAASLDDTVELFRAYVESLPFEIPDYDAWLAELPGEYDLLLARADGASAGCGCYRSLDETTGEIKRMFVREEFRGRGIARSLVDECIALGRAAGHERIRLDTHSTLTPARRLYESIGFREIPPYWDHPIPDVVFYELDLT